MQLNYRLTISKLLQRSAPGWFYYGTLFASNVQGKKILNQVFDALGGVAKFYDLNLRPGSDSPELVVELLECANVVKLNEEELLRVQEFSGLPLDTKHSAARDQPATVGGQWRLREEIAGASYLPPGNTSKRQAARWKSWTLWVLATLSLPHL